MFKGKKKKRKERRIRELVWKNKMKKERKERDRKYSFMREFRCKNEKAGKKRMEKIMLKMIFFLLLLFL